MACGISLPAQTTGQKVLTTRLSDWLSLSRLNLHEHPPASYYFLFFSLSLKKKKEGRRRRRSINNNTITQPLEVFLKKKKKTTFPLYFFWRVSYT
jgi:hypothetical protein